MASSLTMVYDIIARDRASAVFARTGTAAESSATKIGTLGKALGIFAAIDIGAHAVKAAANFQTATTLLVTSAGEQRKALGSVRQGLLDLSGQVGISATDLAKGMYLIESAGFHGADGLNVMKAAAQGAAIEGANVETVANAVTTALKDYNRPAADAAVVTDQLVAAVSRGKVRLEDMSSAMAKVLPAAAAAKVSFAEAAGALATMTSQGTDANLAATYLRQTILQLENPTKKARNEMEGLGLDANDVSQHLGDRGLTGTLTVLTDAIQRKLGPAGLVALDTLRKAGDNSQQFQKALDSLPPPMQTAIGALANMVGGTKSMQAALELTGPHMADFKANVAAVGAAANTTSKDVTGWEDVQKTFNQRLKEAKATAGAVGIEIGTVLLPAVSAAAKAFGSGAGFIQRNSDVIGPLAKIVGIAAVSYFGISTAMSLYEKAAIRVALIQGGLNDLWLKGGSNLGGFATQLGASIGKFALVTGGVLAVTSALHDFTSSGSNARKALDDLNGQLGFDSSNPDTYAQTIAGLHKKLDDLRGPASFFKGILGSITFGATGPGGATIIQETNDIQHQLDVMSGKSSSAKEAIFELGKQYHLSDAQVISLAHGMGIDLSGGIQQSIDKFRSLISTQSQWMQIAADQKSTIIGFNDSLRHLGENLATNRKDWSENTDAGKQNWQTLQTATGWYSRYAQSLQAAGPLTQAQTDKLHGMYDQLLNTITGLVGNRDQAKNLLDQLNLLPPDKSVPVSLPGIGAAIGDVNTLADALRGIPPTKDILVRIHQDIQQAGPAAPFATGSAGIQGPADPFSILNSLQPHADGGFITGPGGPRDDRIPALLSNGEFVVRASRTKAFRPLLDAINGTSGGSIGHFATGGPVVAGKDQTVADFKLTAAKPQPKVFDELFKAPVESQKRNQAAIDKAAKLAFVDPQANALDLSTKAAHTFADTMPKDFAKTVTSHTADVQTAYKVSTGDPWQRTTDGMNQLADQTGRSVPAKIVSGFNNAVGAVKAAADQLLSLIQKPIDLLHGKTIQIVANTSITGVVTAATGGHIRGPGSETSDSIPAMLSDGEFVVNAAATKKHLPLLHHINKAHHYADGGLVTPELSLTGSAAKMSASLDKMMSIATDKLSTEAQKRADAFAATFLNFMGPPGSSFQDIIAVMQTSGLPFLINSTVRNGGGTSYHDRGMAVDFGAPGNNPGQLTAIARWWDRYGGALLEQIYSGDGGHFIKDGRRVPASFYSSVLAEHFNHVHIAATDAAMQRILGAGSGTGGGVQQWAGVILRALQMNGLSPSLLGKVESQMQTESGGNRTILQQVHDINSGPNAARGLMQVIPTTFAAYHMPGTSGDIFDPLANVAAALNYAKQRYGPGLNGLGQGHGYANGGMPPVGRPFWVGERGPEKMVLGAGGATVLSSERSHRMAGSSGPLMHVENMNVARDVDLQRELARAEFLRQTANGL